MKLWFPPCSLFSKGGGVSVEQLRDNFNSPHLIQKEGRFDDLVRSLVQHPSQSFDNFVTQDLTNHLFQVRRLFSAFISLLLSSFPFTCDLFSLSLFLLHLYYFFLHMFFFLFPVASFYFFSFLITFFLQSFPFPSHQTPQSFFGMDLMSLNIQRGRDHAIGTYNSIREVYDLPRARNFDDLRDQINPRVSTQKQI